MNELEEDIELLKKINITVFGTKEELDKLGRNLEDIDVNKIIENLINKIKELEKVVELMAKDIAKNDIDEDICRKVKNKTSEEDDCYGDDYDMCKDCVIEFYKKKVKGD